MNKNSLLSWTAANALGLGVGFVVALQTIMLIQFGFDTKMHWNFGAPVGQSGWAYAARLVANIVHGALWASAQVLILRSHSVRVAPWIISTIAAFGLIVGVEWLLMAVNLWGRIPGPVEPIIVLVGGGSLAGIFQYLVLRRRGTHAAKWLGLWIAGLVASCVPTAAFFITLEVLGIHISWPMEVFFSGFLVAGVAALISGKALLNTLCDEPEKSDGMLSQATI